MGTYKINDIAAATYHRLLKLVPNKSLDPSLFNHGLIYIICVFMNHKFR